MKKKLLASSICLNLLFLLLSGVVLYKKGGYSYVVAKASATFSPKAAGNFTPYHEDRVSLFDKRKMEPNAIVFAGDSLTDNNEWSESFPIKNVYNRGIGRDTTLGVLDRISQLTESQPSKIFIMVGINDLMQGDPKEKILSNYKDIVGQIKTKSPSTSIYIESVLPINTELSGQNNVNPKDILWVNERLNQLAKEGGFTYIDLYSLFSDGDNQLKISATHDGVHLTGESYILWENKIKSYVLDTH